MKKTVFNILILFSILCMSACGSRKAIETERAQRAQSGQGEIKIAMVWSEPPEITLADEGALMAVAEINEQGGILGRKLQLQLYFDVSTNREPALARKIAADPTVAAVIGHSISGTAIPISLTYQQAGLLFISTGSTSPKLTNHGFSYIFRNIPSDIETGKVLAEYCAVKGFKKMVVIDDESEYGVTLANIFVEDAAKEGIEIVLRKSYFPWQTDYKLMLRDIKQRVGDAIFLGGSMPQAAEVIKQARQMGIEVPFIGGDGLDEPILLDIAGVAAEGTVVSTIFDPADSHAVTQHFAANFLATYGVAPDTWAALNYDAIYLLKAAYTRADSTVPLVAASFLRFIENHESVTGTYSFTKNGDILGKHFFFKVVRNGRFEYEGKLKVSDEKYE